MSCGVYWHTENMLNNLKSPIKFKSSPILINQLCGSKEMPNIRGLRTVVFFLKSFPSTYQQVQRHLAFTFPIQCSPPRDLVHTQA